jgi:GT2 family glycosyltransferase
VDLSYRARLRGYRCRYAADAVVRHHGSATLGKVSPFAVYHGQRNLEWVYLKNTPGLLLIRTLPAHMVYAAAAALYFAQRGLLGAFVRAKIAAMGGMMDVLRKRALVQRTRRASIAAIQAQFERGWLSLKRREKQFDVGLAQNAR